MKRLLAVLGLLLVSFFVLLIVGFVVVDRITEPKTTSTTADEGGFEITAVDLYLEYERNAVAADERFKGRRLDVSGTVKAIGNDITNTAYVLLGDNPDNPLGVQALFDESSRGAVARLAKGERVRVVCNGAGKLVNVILRRCDLR